MRKLPIGDRPPEGKLHGRGVDMLQSAKSLQGYFVEATDGNVGHVEDLIIAEEDWAVRYLVIDTRNWLAGKRVLISTEWIEAVDLPDRTVALTVSREQVLNSPPFDPSQPVNRQYEMRLYDYYGRPKYWA